MGEPRTDKLRTYYPSKYLTADDDPLTAFVVDSGSLNTIVDAQLTEVDDYWKGAIGYFDGNTSTAELQGQFFHVENFDAANDTLILSKDLPEIPATGDIYYLIVGGNYRSSQETFGMLVSGILPELGTINGTNITGITLKKAATKLGEGTLHIFYNKALEELYIKMGAENYGVGLDVSTDVLDGIIFSEDGQSFIQIDVAATNLPAEDQTDTFTLSYARNVFSPDYEGYETKNGEGGLTRYRLECLKNTDPVGAMIKLAVMVGRPSSASSTINAGESLGITEGMIEIANAADMPKRSFWVKNTTANGGAGDCRYVEYVSGNTLHCNTVDWAILNFDSGTNEIVKGNTITDAITGATAVVDQIVLESGDWGTNDAAGYMLIKKVNGTFTDNNNIEVAAVVMAVSNGDAVLGMRGYNAVNWNASDTLEVVSDIDIGIDKPGANQYENPADVYTAPVGVIFKDAYKINDMMVMGDLGPGKLHGVWIREWIVSDHQIRDNVVNDRYYFWS